MPFLYPLFLLGSAFHHPAPCYFFLLFFYYWLRLSLSLYCTVTVWRRCPDVSGRSCTLSGWREREEVERKERKSRNPLYIHTLLDRVLGHTHIDHPAYDISLLAMQSDMKHRAQVYFQQIRRKIRMKIFVLKCQRND